MVEVYCQPCQIAVTSVVDRPWHLSCGKGLCPAKRRFWRNYISKWLWERAPAIVLVSIGLVILCVLAIRQLSVTIARAATEYHIDAVLQIGLLLFGLYFLRQTFLGRPVLPAGSWQGAFRGSTAGGNSAQSSSPNGDTQSFESDWDAQASPNTNGAADTRQEPTDSSEDQEAQSDRIAPDTTVGSALAYIRFGRWGRSFLDAAETNPTSLAELALNSFLQSAAAGTIQVWGKRQSYDPLEQIDVDYWRNHTIDRLSLLKDKPFTVRVDGTGRRPGTVSFQELMTSKSQAEALWRRS